MGSDAELVARLQAGDEEAFLDLVDRYHTALIRLATTFVPSRAVAEEAVQDTWLAVVRGIERFEGRSSLKTWLFRILVNRARTAGQRERRTEPVPIDGEPAVDPARFGPGGTWSDPPPRWEEEAENRLLAGDMAERIQSCLAQLPDAQRHAVLLRDMEGLSSREASAVLGVSEGNLRVLLHRARSRVRGMLEPELGKD